MSNTRAVLAMLALLAVLGACADAEDPHDPNCIMGVQVDYSSGIEVTTEDDARRVFEQFVADSRARGVPIFGDAYGNEWRFESASDERTFEGVLYRQVEASWRSPEDGRWRAKSVFSVSERGDVARLLGCV